MTKKKKIIVTVISLFLAIIVLGIILFFTAFSLKRIDIQFESTTNRYSTSESVSQILNGTSIDYGKSVFLLNKEPIISSIEKNNPYLKVVNLEIKFPRNMILHVVERQQLFAFTKETKTYICDEDAKVLSMVDGFSSINNNAILVDNLVIEQNQINVGDFLDFNDFDKNNLKIINNAFALNNRTKVEAMGYFKSISFGQRINPSSFVQETTVVLKNHEGFEYEIFGLGSQPSLKFNKLFSSDAGITEDLRSDYKLLVYENSLGEVFAKLKYIS